MINNDVLRSVRYMLDLSDTHVANLVQYADPAVVLERDAVQAYLLREDEPGFVPLDDRLLGLFLAGPRVISPREAWTALGLSAVKLLVHPALAFGLAVLFAVPSRLALGFAVAEF